MSFRRGIIDLIEDFLKQTKILYIDNDRYVMKTYSGEPGLVKWFIIRSANVLVQVYPFTFNPWERMQREIYFLEDLRPVLRVPKVFVKDWITPSVVREYIDGESFDPESDTASYRSIGRTMALLHNSGYVMGDSKYSNFLRISTSNSYTVIDAEQAIRSNNNSYRYWDILVFSTTVIYKLISNKPLRKIREVREKIESFIEGYMSSADNNAYNILSLHKKFSYKALTYILLPFPYNSMYSKIINSYLSNKD